MNPAKSNGKPPSVSRASEGFILTKLPLAGLIQSRLIQVGLNSQELGFRLGYSNPVKAGGELGQVVNNVMSALPPKADFSCSAPVYVRFVPKADIVSLHSITSLATARCQTHGTPVIRQRVSRSCRSGNLSKGTGRLPAHKTADEIEGVERVRSAAWTWSWSRAVPLKKQLPRHAGPAGQVTRSFPAPARSAPTNVLI